jgi:glycosyltransferase involved in cell wall biosynthesis
VDKKSTMLGFFHNWIIELSKQYTHITVITLKAGEYELPSNVTVYSLGKEVAGTRFVPRKIRYLFRFYYLVLTTIRTHDSVFIHQIQEYALLGGLLWRLYGTRVFLWRNHYAGNILTDIACRLSNTTFYTSDYSYNASFSNALKMPVGVDVESLKTTEVFSVPHNSILILARLDPSKKPEIVLHALKKLRDAGTVISADFVGGTNKNAFPHYEQEIMQLHANLELGDSVRFVGAVPSTETYKYYLSHEIYINVSKSGMLDKTIFKALAAGCLPLTTSLDFNEMIQPVVGDECKVSQDSVDSLVERLAYALSLSHEEKKRRVKMMQDVVLTKSSLKTLVAKLVEII